MSNKEILTHALINSRARGIVSMNQDVAHHHRILLQELEEKWHVDVIDGRPIESGDKTHCAKVEMTIQDHNKQLLMFITKSGHSPIILGIGPQRQFDIAVQFVLNTVMFCFQYCITHYFNRPVEVQCVMEEPQEQGYPLEGNVYEPQIQPQQQFWENIDLLNRSFFFQAVKKEKSTVFNGSL